MLDRLPHPAPSEPAGTTAAPPSGAPSLTIEGARATVWLNRPDHHNRLEPGDITALDGMLDRLEGERDIRVLVLRARGKSFCAGYDLKDLAGGGTSAVGSGGDGGIGDFAALVDRLEDCPMPSIGVLNGPVYGGGTDLALACDFRIGTPACRMFMPAGRFGLHYYHGGLRRYATRLGLGPAKRLFLLGEAIEADEMRRIGYLDDVVDDLDARLDEMVRPLLEAASSRVTASVKRELNRIASADMDPTGADAAWAASRRSPEVAAAVAAHLANRRKP